MIPKKIHYCWFSGKAIPAEFERYIESWRKYCPDYEIIQWDESNYDINRNAYMKDAYKEKRWGFVPDYARFDIIYNEGGIYLDTDVELVKPLDEMLSERAFIGFESASCLNAGLGFGAEAGNPVIRELRDMYDFISFYRENGKLNLVPSPHYISEKLKDMGIKLNNQYQKLENITVYPTQYLGPKDYTTGEIHKTVNTYSIHHFSGTWLTEEEKLAEKRRLRYCSRYGEFLGNRVDGITKRLRKIQDKKNPLNPFERLKEHFLYSDEKANVKLNTFEAFTIPSKEKITQIVLLTPAAKTNNFGDNFIEESCLNELSPKLQPLIKKVSTHTHPKAAEQNLMKKAELTLVAGSNLLSDNVRHSQWKLPSDYTSLSRVCTMGCGWSSYSEPDEFSIRFYKKLLNNGWLHSVRDRYTEEKLRKIGISNVIYTGCPTMWDLTKKHCDAIPTKKSDAVITALTSYQKDSVRDAYQIHTLLDTYKTVYFWPQGTFDRKYIEGLLSVAEEKKIVFLERNWSALLDVLQSCHPDYIGNRLHAGIFCLKNGCRTRIIAIDNRAIEIGKDTNLPIIRREKLDSELTDAIFSELPLSIVMPWQNIKLWKEQFEDLTI